MAIAESLGFSSSSSMVRGLLYALTDNHPDAMRVRKRFGFDRPDDEESRTEIRIAREILGLEDEPGQAEPT